MPDRRNLTPDEVALLIKRDGMRCFIDGHPIESEADMEFDHIKPLVAGGPTTLDNLAQSAGSTTARRAQ